MKRFNLQALMDELQDPYIRVEIDKNYDDHWDDSRDDDDDDHWLNQFGDKRAREMDTNTLTLQYRFLARDMIDASYPLDLGTYKKLNGKGKALVEMEVVSGFDFHSVELVEGSRDSSWKTFRDGNPTNIRSIMTGTKAIPFKCHWLDLEGDGVDDICGTPAPLNLKGKGKSKATAMKKILQAIRPPCVTSRAHVDEDGRDAKAAATE
jgi:hypothetical protein